MTDALLSLNTVIEPVANTVIVLYGIAIFKLTNRVTAVEAVQQMRM